MRGKEIKTESVDDEEDSAFVGRRKGAWRCGVCTRRDSRKGQPAEYETSHKDIYANDVKGKKKKKDPGPKHHSDDKSQGAGSLFSNEVSCRQLVCCQRTEVSLSQDIGSGSLPILYPKMFASMFSQSCHRTAGAHWSVSRSESVSPGVFFFC